MLQKCEIALPTVLQIERWAMWMSQLNDDYLHDPVNEVEKHWQKILNSQKTKQETDEEKWKRFIDKIIKLSTHLLDSFTL